MTQSFPVPQEVVEAGLLNAVNQSMANWLQVSSYATDDFSAHREIFQFIGQYLVQYGSLPSSSQINTRFSWQPPVGDFAYWNTEMKRYALARKVISAVQSGYSQISDPHLALNTLLQNLSMIRASETTHIQSYDSGAVERLARFDFRTEYFWNNNNMLGLPTGMAIIDNTGIGWTEGSLVGAYSRPGVGKTWWLMWEGIQAWKVGATVLAIVPEMPANELSIRIDTIMGNELGIPLDYNMLRRGDPAVRPNYSLLVQTLQQSQRWWMYDSLDQHAMGLGDIAALIRQHQPGIVLVDGVSLLRYEGRGATWEQMKDICYGLKALATIYSVPIIITHQATNSRRGQRGEDDTQGRGDDFHMPNLNDAAYGDAIVQACSDIITFCAEPTNSNVNWYSIRKHRERGLADMPRRMALAVDFGHGKIIDLSPLGYDVDRVSLESRRILNI